MIAFIFDLDGTLVESLPGIAQSLNMALAEHKLSEYDELEVIEFIGDGSRALCKKAAPHEPTHIIDSIEASFKTHYTRKWRDGTRPFEGIPELLNLLQSQRIPIAVLSNKPHPFTVEIVETLFPSIKFLAVMGQVPEIKKKPDPAGAKLLLSQLKSNTKTYLIGDSGVDLETAKNANISSIAVHWGYETLEELEGSEYSCKNVAELTALIKELAKI